MFDVMDKDLLANEEALAHVSSFPSMDSVEEVLHKK